ncbi:MAG: hypothetical protein QM528_08980 [Phycisphaerales bacterium]|nr:hypothetical protein [Phycisphaerales bacterium]
MKKTGKGTRSNKSMLQSPPSNTFLGGKQQLNANFSRSNKIRTAGRRGG